MVLKKAKIFVCLFLPRREFILSVLKRLCLFLTPYFSRDNLISLELHHYIKNILGILKITMTVELKSD